MEEKKSKNKEEKEEGEKKEEQGKKEKKVEKEEEKKEEEKEIKREREEKKEIKEKSEEKGKEEEEEKVEKEEEKKEKEIKREREEKKEIKEKSEEKGKEEEEKVEKEEIKKEEKEEEKKEEEKKGKRKKEAVVRGKDLPISTKHAVAVCRFIKNKSIDKAIEDLEKVLKKKMAVPMKGEIPHRKGKIMSGRYPFKTATFFIKLLKSLKANALVNELELEKCRIYCKADIASRPYRRFGIGRKKRTHVQIKLVEKENGK